MTRIQAIAKYRQSVENMRKKVLEHNRYASAEVRAISGVIQHITLDIEILPDHKSLLAKTPRIFDKYK